MLRRRFPGLSKLSFITISCATPGVLLANPSGGQVAAGSITINQLNAGSTQITQTTDRGIINWQQFNVGVDEYVQFIQPGSSSVTLNRVVGGNPSSILGNLSANGQIFIVNQQGVFFGPGSTIDVQGLVASTLNISDANFMAGNYQFNRESGTQDGASVINQGVIAARESGYVVLAGDYVENSGVIQAQLGDVVLASGSQMTLDIVGDGLISFTVDSATVSSLAGAKNTGELYADGGRVIMTAKVANDLASAAVNNEGIIRAQTIAEKEGEIYLLGEGAAAQNTGTLDVRDPAGQNAGTIEISSDTGIKVRGVIEGGKGGDLIIDPAVLIVSSFGSGGTTGSTFVDTNVIQTQLNAGMNVALSASSMITFGYTSYGGSINASGLGNLTFSINDGTGSIALNGYDININGSLTLAAGTASGGITGISSLNASSIVLTGHDAMATGNLSANSIVVNNIGSITINGNINAGSGSGVRFISGGDIVQLSGSSINVSAAETDAFLLFSGANISQQGGFSLYTSLGNAVARFKSSGSVSVNNGTLNGAGTRLIVGSSLLIDSINAPVASATVNNISATAGSNDSIIRVHAAGNITATNLSANATLSTARGRLVSQNGNVTASNISYTGLVDARTRYVANNAVNLSNISMVATNNRARIRVENNSSVGTVNLNGLNVISKNGTARIFLGSDGTTPPDDPLVQSGDLQVGSVSGNNIFIDSPSTNDSIRVFTPYSVNLTNLRSDVAYIRSGTQGNLQNITLGQTDLSFIDIGGYLNTVSVDNNLSNRNVTFNFNQFSSTPLNSLFFQTGASAVFNNLSTDPTINGVSLSAMGDLTIAGTGINAGGGVAPNETGDFSLTSFLSSSGITDGGGFTTPNAIYHSAGILTLDVSAQTDGYRYIAWEADDINFTGVSTAPGLLIQIAPFTNNADISISQNGTIGAGFQYSANDFLNAFTGTTAVIGYEDYVGNIIFEESIPFSDKNVLVVTHGTVSNIENVITTGIVAIVPIVSTSSSSTFVATLSTAPVVTSPTGGTTTTTANLLTTDTTTTDSSQDDDEQDDTATGTSGSTQIIAGGLIEVQNGGTSNSQSCP